MWAVVPIKGFDAPKQRLADVLSQEERGNLAEHMLRDVLGALVNLEGVVVISGDEQALNLARWQGARVMQERQPGGYSAAVRQAGQALAGEGVEAAPPVEPARLGHTRAVSDPLRLQEVGESFRPLSEAKRMIRVHRAVPDQEQRKSP